MKKLSILAMGLLFVLTTACSVSGSGTLFDGKDSNKWKMTGDVSVQDDIMTLKGTDALVVLKNGQESARSVGFLPKQALQDMFDNYILEIRTA